MFNNQGIRYNVNGEYFMSLTEVSGYTGCSVNRINKALGNTSSCDINGYHIIRETNNTRLASSNRFEYIEPEIVSIPLKDIVMVLICFSPFIIGFVMLMFSMCGGY